ncbi:MAG: hypothetical protein ACRDG9_06930, partial [Actinomycetota bacterium]
LAFGMSNAFAQGVSMGKDRDLNTKQMAEAQTHAKAALEAAKGGNAPSVAEHARKSWGFCKEVTGETVMPYYEPAMEKLTSAISLAEKGDAAGAVAPLEESVAKMSEGLANYDY